LSSRLVTADVDGSTLIITLNRPEKRNAIDQTVATELEAALDQLQNDPTVRVGILTAVGPVFCAGTDLSLGVTPKTDRGGEYGIARRARDKPLIAAVEGPALGGGMEIVLACDLVVASTNARFGLPEVRVGVVANCGALFRGPRALPVNIAAQLLLTGEPIDALAARDAHLVNIVTEPGQSLPAAEGLAARVALGSPAAITATLRALNAVRGPAEDLGWQATACATEQASASPDWEEGIAAFLERRPPSWQ
jgi:enoyl-CoA hydratase/carnithine racemase